MVSLLVNSSLSTHSNPNVHTKSLFFCLDTHDFHMQLTARTLFHPSSQLVCTDNEDQSAPVNLSSVHSVTPNEHHVADTPSPSNLVSSIDPYSQQPSYPVQYHEQHHSTFAITGNTFGVMSTAATQSMAAPPTAAGITPMHQHSNPHHTHHHPHQQPLPQQTDDRRDSVRAPSSNSRPFARESPFLAKRKQSIIGM